MGAGVYIRRHSLRAWSPVLGHGVQPDATFSAQYLSSEDCPATWRGRCAMCIALQTRQKPTRSFPLCIAQVCTTGVPSGTDAC